MTLGRTAAPLQAKITVVPTQRPLPSGHLRLETQGPRAGLPADWFSRTIVLIHSDGHQDVRTDYLTSTELTEERRGHGGAVRGSSQRRVDHEALSVDCQSFGRNRNYSDTCLDSCDNDEADAELFDSSPPSSLSDEICFYIAGEGLAYAYLPNYTRYDGFGTPYGWTWSNIAAWSNDPTGFNGCQDLWFANSSSDATSCYNTGKNENICDGNGEEDSLGVTCYTGAGSTYSNLNYLFIGWGTADAPSGCSSNLCE